MLYNFVLEKLKLWLKKKNIPVRLIVAVIAGIIISKVLMLITHKILHVVGVFPPMDEPNFDRDLLIIALAFHSFYAIVAAYFTAQIAKDRARKAVFILGTKEAIMWLVGILLLWHLAPAWFNLTKAILGIPLSIFGGWIYRRTHPQTMQTEDPSDKKK
ncbi:MAG: hypothetical protein JWO32_2437 [Bacteroidetes bacterium]|nr:hypothetical protein [Bacteroidota bacterium]